MQASKDEIIKEESLVLQLNGKKYIFSAKSIKLFIIGSPLLCILLYIFLSSSINYWLYELTTRNVVLFLNFLFRIDSEAIILQEQNIFPKIYIPNHPLNVNFSITTDCVATHVFSLIIGLIIFIPASKDPDCRKNFIFRKIKTLVISILVIYFLNVIRLAVLLSLTYNGVPFDFIHQSLFFLSAIIGALFLIVILYKWLPEIFISLYYFYRLKKK